MIIEYLKKKFSLNLGLVVNQKDNIANKAISTHYSPNKKGVIYQLPTLSCSLLASYQIFHEDGEGSVLINFIHLRHLNSDLEASILKNSELGNLGKVNYLYQKRQLIYPLNFTHRLEVFRCQASKKKLAWLIDLDFHKPYSYGSGTGLEVIKYLLFYLLKNDFKTREYCDFLDRIIAEDWYGLIKNISENKYGQFNDSRINCIVNKFRKMSCTYKLNSSKNKQKKKPFLKKNNEKVDFCCSECIVNFD